ALSLGAGEAAYKLAHDALALTPADDPLRPHLQIVAGYAGRLVGTDDAAELLQPAIEGFIAQGDPGHAAEAAVLLGSALFYRGDMDGVRVARNQGLELARKAPPSASTALALANVSRSLALIDRKVDEALTLSREAL